VARVFVAPVSFGLGDLVVSLPAIQALIDDGRRQGCETWLVTRSAAQAALADRIAGLGGSIADEAFDRAGSDTRFVDLRDHPLQRDYWWGSAEFTEAFGPLSINDILARICADLDIAADFARPHPLLAHPHPGLESTVLLVAQTDGPAKQWPTDRWCALASAIRRRGLAVAVVTRQDTLVDVGAMRFDAEPAPTPCDAVDVLSAARAVVGIDTGLTHIAAQQGTPTVMIARWPAEFFRPWPHTRAVVGSRCDEMCAAQEQTYAYNRTVDLRGFEWEPRQCPSGAPCLDGVLPADVMAALEELL
jgi:Glycosyltransferase family 9 (heptosyltransferase)